MAFPRLYPTQGQPTAPGISYTFSVEGTLPETFFVTFVSGLDTVSVDGKKIEGDMIITIIPDTAMGQTYAFVTSADAKDGPLVDDIILFGPTVLEVTPSSPVFDIALQ